MYSDPLPFHGFQWSLIVEHIHTHSRVSWCTLDIPYKKGWRQAFQNKNQTLFKYCKDTSYKNGGLPKNGEGC